MSPCLLKYASSLLLVTISISFCSAFLRALAFRTQLSQRPTHATTPLRAENTLKVVVIGGGWAGFSAADAISDADVSVELLDASPRGPGGLAGGFRKSKLQRPVEAGLHGFWREYRNTIAALERIEGIDVEEVLTPYTPSILVSESGRVAVAPVLGSPEGDHNVATSFSSLDWSNPDRNSRTSRLSFADRISAVGLLGCWADFGQEDAKSWARYDKITAENLFRSIVGISPTLYRELVLPLLHVLPMTTGYDCSAAAALSCFHVFALQSRGAFDVRWCRGTIGEMIFNPWASKLQGRGNVKIRGSSKVSSFTSNEAGGYTVVVNENETLHCDAVVFAVGGTSMKRLLPSCPPLQQFPVAQNFHKLRGVTCVAVRLFLKPDEVTTSNLKGGMYNSTQLPPRVAEAMNASPVVVCGARVGGLPELAETGFCVYDLQRLHDEFAVSNQASSDQEACAAIEVDFFRADTIADIKSDMSVAKLALRAVSSALNVDVIDASLVLDVSVVRARNAVSHFCVDSASASPAVRMTKGIYMAGDWIDRTGHASWSTEKAVVSGRQAAAALTSDFGLKVDIAVIPAAPDTPQLNALRQASTAAMSPLRGAMSLLGRELFPVSPWILAKQISPWRQI